MRGGPRLGDRDPRADPLEPPLDPGDVEQLEHRQPRDGAAVGAHPAAPLDQVLAAAVGGHRLAAQLARRVRCTASWVGPTNVPPRSTGVPAIVVVDDRPPTRSRPSSTTTSYPSPTRSRAAVRPANPAPTTTTSSAGCVTRLGSHAVKVMTALFGPSMRSSRRGPSATRVPAGCSPSRATNDVFAPLTLASTVGWSRPDDQRRNRVSPQPDSPRPPGDRPPDCSAEAGSRSASARRSARRSRSGSARDFDKPVARMTELVAALRAIFHAWETGERLDFRGEYYRHTLMTPTFSPGENPYGPPPIYVGALGPRLTRATAEHADGLLVMPFGNKRFLHEVTMPAVREGLAAAGKSVEDFAVIPEIIVSGRRRPHRHPPPARLLRLDAGLPPGARDPRLGRSAARAQCAVQAGPLGGDGRAHRRRRAAHHRRLRHGRRGRCPHPGPGRRRIRPDLPLPARSHRAGDVGRGR